MGSISFDLFDNPGVRGSRSSSVESLEDYKPFLSQVFVSLGDSSEIKPVQILIKNSAEQTLLLEGVLPLSAQTSTGESVFT